jgi:prepilin-type N-terminal cleavage/methylation domain-containing protein
MPTRSQRGFTLIEVLIALVLVTLISVAIMGSLGPWLSFKEKLDTQHKLADAEAAIQLAYTANAMTVDSVGANYIQLSDGAQMLASTTQNGRCVANQNTWQALSNFLPEGPRNSSLDGFQQPFCVFISNQLSAPGPGATVYYHNIAIVSLGTSGLLDPATSFDANTGALNVAGDNTGILVNGYAVQLDKLNQTQKQLDKIASTYETYFTSEYLSTASRDVTIDYFANSGSGALGWDANGSVMVTSGWTAANTVLQPIGVSQQDAQTPYESNNVVLVGNTQESLDGATVRSPASNFNAPPYTALLAAPLPGPNGNYLIETVHGNY